MRIFISILAAMALVCATPLTAQARQDTSTVTIPRSALTPQQQSIIDQQVSKEKIETYGKWVGLGKEVGEAVNGSLGAVTEQTAKFANTDVGHVTMAIIVWKVIGRDILGVFFAFVVWSVGFPVWQWSYRKTAMLQRVMTKETVGPDGKVTAREYKTIEPYDNDPAARAITQFLHGAAFFGLIAIGSCAIFR